MDSSETFTGVCVYDTGKNSFTTRKVSSIPHDPSVGIAGGVEQGLLPDLSDVFWNGTPVAIAVDFHPAIRLSAQRIAQIAAGNDAVYGVNAGFRKLASIRIDAADTATPQRNLIFSHCCRFWSPPAEPIVRLIMTLKLISLGRGASGARPGPIRPARSERFVMTILAHLRWCEVLNRLPDDIDNRVESAIGKKWHTDIRDNLHQSEASDAMTARARYR